MLDGLPAAILNPFDSLRRRLAVLFAVVLLPPTVLSLYLAWSAFEEQSDKARLSVRQFASLVSAYERDFFNDTQRLLVNLSADPAIKQMEFPECRGVLHRALENFPESSLKKRAFLISRIISSNSMSRVIFTMRKVEG